MRESTRVLLALGAGLAGGAAVAASGNARLLDVALAVAPVGVIWINAIRMTVIPLVVALHITGVASASDLRAIGRIGGRTLLVFFLLLLGTALVVMPLAPPVFALLPMGAAARTLPPGAAEAAGQLAASGAAPTFGGWVGSLAPPPPRRGGGAGRDAAADPLHAAARAGDRAEPARGARHPARILSRAERGDAGAGALGGGGGPDRRVRAGPPPRGPRRRGNRRRGRVLRGGVFGGKPGGHSAALSHSRASGRDPDGAVRPGGAARAAGGLRLVVLDRFAAGAGGGGGEGPRPVEAGERLRAAVRGLHVPRRGTGLLDDRRAVRRLVLRHPAARGRARDGGVRGDLPRVRGAGGSARGLPDAHPALPRHRPSGGGDRHPDRGGPDSGPPRDRAQRHRRSRGGGDRGPAVGAGRVGAGRGAVTRAARARHP